MGTAAGAELAGTSGMKTGRGGDLAEYLEMEKNVLKSSPAEEAAPSLEAPLPPHVDRLPADP
ncbi:MAG: hypothetical protein JWO82_2198 [Akkermansiaceae bacterium]|nr:hypothetical protein [Akkermansiaceae bacterium]